MILLLFGEWSKCVGDHLQRCQYLNTAYHRSVCAELRIPAKTGQFLPAPKALGCVRNEKTRRTIKLGSPEP